jgi:hypothetical protein
VTPRPLLVPLALALSAVLGACAGQRSRPNPRPTIAESWAAALASSHRAADEGRYVDADRELAVFGSMHPGTPEAAESAYWRALYKLDPRNTAATARDAVNLVDTVLLSGSHHARRAEAVVLRRTALVLDSLRRQADAPKTTLVIRDTARDVARERNYEEQIKMLQDSLGKTLAELDRIRKRITTPRP